MTHRTIRRPHGVGREGGDQRHGECQVQKFAHGKTVSSRVQAWIFIEPEILETDKSMSCYKIFHGNRNLFFT
jgi:hypothetical protein